jgi:hypothetical protein
MTDCRDCKNCQRTGYVYLCLANRPPLPTSMMRDHRSECGLSGALFAPKQPAHDEAGEQ